MFALVLEDAAVVEIIVGVGLKWGQAALFRENVEIVEALPVGVEVIAASVVGGIQILDILGFFSVLARR